MKNHFFIAYPGNKREEVETIYNYIIKNVDMNKIKTIIEPFCGTSSMSYYISLIHPKKFKYILNDNNKHLIELYKTLSDNIKTEKFVKDINLKCFDSNDKFINKEQYLKLIKEDNKEAYFIKQKYYTIRAGLYPQRICKKLVYDDFIKTPIINFLKTENIELTTEDAITCIEKYTDTKNIILCDPPYMETVNNVYQSPNGNIYEYIYKFRNKIKNVFFILEYMWIIRLLFQNENTEIYTKIYNGMKKKAVEHAIIYLK